MQVRNEQHVAQRRPGAASARSRQEKRNHPARVRVCLAFPPARPPCRRRPRVCCCFCVSGGRREESVELSAECDAVQLGIELLGSRVRFW